MIIYHLKCSRNNYKKISILLIVIFLFIVFLPFKPINAQSDSISRPYKVYICNGIQANALKGEDSSGSFTNYQNSFSSTDYDKIQIDDDNFVAYTTMTHISVFSNGCAYNLFNFTIKDSIDNISKIDITWKGYGGCENVSGPKKYGYSLWVKENNQYVNKTGGTHNSKDTLTVTYTSSDIQNIINNYHMYIGVQSDYPVIRNTNRNDPNNQESFLYSYYIEVNVSLNQDLEYLEISSPTTVEEGDGFLVSVTSNSNPVENAKVEFNNNNYLTNQDGIASIPEAPIVLTDTYYSIFVSKAGYYDSESNILVENEEVPTIKNLRIVSMDSVYEGGDFLVSVFSDGVPVEGVVVSFDGGVFYSDSDGLVSLSAPFVDVDSDFLISTSKSGFVSDEEFVTVLDEGSCSVKLVSPNGGEVFSDVVDIYWNVINAPVDSFSVKLEYFREGGSADVIVDGFEGSSGFYSWDVSDLSNYDDYFVRVSVFFDGDSVFDVSDSSFSISNSEEIVNGWIYGLVVNDDDLIPINDVLVCVKSSSNENICRYTTRQGYSISLPAGVYTVKFTKNGFETKEYENIEIMSDQGTALDLILTEIETQQTQSFTDYSISEQIKKGTVIGSVDVKEDKQEVNIYKDVNIDLISSNIRSDEGVKIKISGKENPGTKIVIYLGEIQDQNNIIVKYDDIQIYKSQNTESFFENNDKKEWILTYSEENGAINTILIVNIPSYSEHFIDISLAAEVISKFAFDTNQIILYFSLIIITSVAAIFHIKYMWKK